MANIECISVLSHWYNLYCQKCIKVHITRCYKTNARTVAKLQTMKANF